MSDDTLASSPHGVSPDQERRGRRALPKINTPRKVSREPEAGRLQPASETVLWVRRDTLFPLLIAGCCGLGALIAIATAFDLVRVIRAAEPIGALSDPPKTSKLLLVLLVLMSVASALSLVAWRIRSAESTHRGVVSQWSIPFTVLWSVVGFYLFCVYYPLPYHSHHIDKLLLGLGLLLLWSVTFALRPGTLAGFLRSRAHHGLTVAAINVLVFVGVERWPCG